MGAGYHGGFGNTSGAAPGDVVYQSSQLEYFNYIAKRKDVDPSGMFDVVAHGAVNAIQIEHNNRIERIDHRTLVNLLKHNKQYGVGQVIRLLSCNTGASTKSFAQNLANKLNVIVMAPTKLVWAYPDGRHIVASRDPNNPRFPNLNDLGKFEYFYPRGKKK